MGKQNKLVDKRASSQAQELALNAMTMRSQALAKLIDQGKRDINEDCGYPTQITPAEYHAMYQREGVAARLVDVWPEECWSTPPEVMEDEDPESTTAFEQAWTELDDLHNLSHYLFRIDKLSGVGRFGILLIGINDSLDLAEPVEGVDDIGKIQGKEKATREILFLRAFDESVVEVAESVTDISNPRFGLPLFYTISFQDQAGSTFSKKVHWHRVLHVADNREMSEVYGTPRMKKLYNRLLDIRKILSGSGEMFWKGAFPGISFEVNSDENSGELDAASLRAEMESYQAGLQRYLALEGVKAKSLPVQVADPTGHLKAQMEYIATTEGIPKRILFGSEQGELASSQDARTWDRRLKKRQSDYLTHMILRPFIDRLMAMGVLPTVETYAIFWPDLMAQTDEEKATITKSWAEAFSKYVAGSVDQMIPEAEFLSIFAGMNKEEIKQIKDARDMEFAEEIDAVATDEEIEAEEAALLKEKETKGDNRE